VRKGHKENFPKETHRYREDRAIGASGDRVREPVVATNEYRGCEKKHLTSAVAAHGIKLRGATPATRELREK